MVEKARINTKEQGSKQKCSNFCKRSSGNNSLNSPADRVLQLQKTAGNQAVQRLIKSRILQAKLRIGQPNDIYEKETDRVAEQIMKMPDPVLQRKCAKCDEDEKRVLRTKKSPGEVMVGQVQDVPSTVHEVLRSPGQPLDTATRAFMESRFGYDFSRVHVHSGSAADQSARDINARAYTVGHNLVFGAGQFTPATHEGRRLIAHELTHVVQQGYEHSSVKPCRLPALKENLAVESQGHDASLLMRQKDDTKTDCPKDLPNRAEEVMLSRTSPGLIATETNPLTLSLLNFAIDDSTPKPEHIQILRELAILLNTHARAQIRMHLVGHTDCTGSVSHNTKLSEQRARTIRAFLAPLLSRHIGISWASELHPVASNSSVEGRSRNRRVDVRFVFVSKPPKGKKTPPSGPETPQSLCHNFPLLCAGLGVPWWFLLLICFIDPLLCLPVPPPPPPPPPPPGPDDPNRQHRNPPQVIFSPSVRAPNTPAGMNDRISNASPVIITATVINPPPVGQNILIEVDGSGTQAGEATVNGSKSIQITDTTVIEVQGKTLTAIGSNAPKLQLGAWFAGDLVGASNQFSVSAIMENWQTVFEDAGDFPLGFDLIVKMHWASDGKSIRDLSGCHYHELVGVAREEGAMQGMGAGGVQDPEDFSLADIMPGGDTHGTERRWLTGPGFQRLHQIWQMRDTRSNSDWVPSRNSGFHIERTYEREDGNPRCWQLRVEKVGRAARIGNTSVAAGSGRAQHVWKHINCEPEPTPPIPIPPEPIKPPEPVPDKPPQCDRAKLDRRVNICIEEARKSAEDCTLKLKLAGGWGGVLQMIKYYYCLKKMREALLECDRRAKEDTGCLDKK